jgi:hypothetical protein
LLAWYLARRRGEGYRRIRFKEIGWNHTFARNVAEVVEAR